MFLGLGSSASHHLIEGMARAGNGTALFASLDERLEKKVLQQLQDALQPSLTGKIHLPLGATVRMCILLFLPDIKVKWDGYDEKNMERKQTSVPVQSEKTLLGYGKPLNEDEPPKPVEQPAKFRQAPQNDAVVKF